MNCLVHLGDFFKKFILTDSEHDKFSLNPYFPVRFTAKVKAHFQYGFLQKIIFRTRMMKIKIKIFTFQLPRFLGGGKVIFETFFSTKMKKKISTNLLNKIKKSFLKFWLLLDKHFSEKQKFHRKGWRKNWFLKSGQGSSSKIFFVLKKSKNFQRQEINFLDIFL